MLLTVTQEDIDLGKINATCCPVALALDRQIPDSEPFVLSGGMRFTLDGKKIRLNNSKVLRNWIRKHDYEGKSAIKPHVFRIDLANTREPRY